MTPFWRPSFLSCWLAPEMAEPVNRCSKRSIKLTQGHLYDISFIYFVLI
jgi:hypothetical protein